MPQPRRIRASVPAGCVTLYFLLAAAIGSITLGLLEGPVVVLTTGLVLGALLTVLSLLPWPLPIGVKGFNIVVVTLMLPAAVAASPQLSDDARWVVAAAGGSLTLGLMAKVPVGRDRWSDSIDLNEICGFVTAPWITHALWAGWMMWFSAMVVSAAGMLWHIAHAHWTNAVTYGVSLAGIYLATLLGWANLERWLVAETLEEEEPKEILASR